MKKGWSFQQLVLEKLYILMQISPGDGNMSLYFCLLLSPCDFLNRIITHLGKKNCFSQLVSGFNAAPLHRRSPPLSLKEEHWWQLVNSAVLFGMTCIPILLSPYVIWGQILNVQDLQVSFLVPLVQGCEGWTLSRHSTSQGFTSLPLERWGT